MSITTSPSASDARQSHLSLTAAYVALGRVAPPFVTRKQHAFYLSLQAAY